MLNKNIATIEQKALLTQTHQILEEVAKSLMVIQKDSANIFDVIDGFSKIERAWLHNNTFLPEIKSSLTKIFNHRIKSLSESQLGVCAYNLREFLNVDPNILHLLAPSEAVSSKFFVWATSTLPDNRLASFEKEKSDLADKRNLEMPINTNSFPVHTTLGNLLKSMPVSEAAVERAFSRHKIVHNRLRANLSTERLEDQLFIRYNFERILGLAQSMTEPDEICEEILNWS